MFLSLNRESALSISAYVRANACASDVAVASRLQYQLDITRFGKDEHFTHIDKVALIHTDWIRAKYNQTFIYLYIYLFMYLLIIYSF